MRIVAAGEDSVSAIATVAFIEALPASVAQKVRVLCGKSASRAQVLEAAKDVWDEDIVEEVAAAARQSYAQKPQIKSHKASLSSSRPATRPKEGRRCFSCGEVGHLRRECQAVCSRCGEVGHAETFCRKRLGNDAGEL